MLSRRALVAALTLVPLAACSSPSPAMSPAASPSGMMSDAAVVVYAPGAMAAHTKKLAAAYESAGKGKVSFEVGHTPIQREQLAKGATPDVWIAANPMDMQTTAEKGYVVKDAVQKLAATKLVVVVAPNNPGTIMKFEDLAEPGKKVLLASETLPIWTTTKKTFDKVDAKTPGFSQKVIANTVSREMGVQPIVQKVQLGEADAGIVFVTDVPADPKGLTMVEVPADVNTMLSLSIAPVTAGKNQDAAKTFIEFMTAGEGKKVLEEAGYLPPAS